MKVIALIALIGFAAAASHSLWNENSLERRHVKDTEFLAKRTYHFKYDAQVATGIPQASEQHAAQRVQAHVAVHMKDQKTALLQIQQVRMATLNRELPEPRQVLPFGLFTEEPIEHALENKLRLPVRFSYENGLVRDVEFDREDDVWSMNIKRAIINLMQINLKKEGRTDLVEQKNMRDITEHREHTDEFFTVQEKTLEGDCETMYTVVRVGEEDNKLEQLAVTKSVNFEKCQKRADLRYNLRFGEICPACEKKFAPETERVAESTSVMHMNVTRPTGQHQRWIVKEAELNAHYSWAPMRPEDNIISAYTTTRIQLVKVEEQPEKKIAEPKAEKKENILYSVELEANKERFYMENDEEFLRELPTAEKMNKVAVVEKLIAQLVKATEHEQEGFTAEAPRFFARLVQMFRIMKSEEVNQIVRKYVEQAEKVEEKAVRKSRDLILDAIAQAGTKVTFEKSVELVKEYKKIGSFKAALMLKTLVNMRTVGEKQLDQMIELCERVEKQPMLKQTCWLTAGAIANQMCRPSEDKLAREVEDMHYKRCTREQKQRIVKRFVAEFEKAETRYQKVLALKAIANSGIDLTVFPLEKIILNKEQREEKTIRLAAIDALRLLRTQMPRKIQHILMPVFKNQHELPEIRMNAVYQLLETQPERAVLEQIAAQLRNERSHQLHSFVYTALATYANSTLPCERRMAEELQVVLRQARIQPRRLMDSRVYHKTLYCNTYKMGTTLNWASIFSNNSYIPKQMSASVDSLFAGQWNKYVAQIGFYQENLDEIFGKLLEQLDEETVTEVLRAQRGKSTKTTTEIVKKIQKALKIERRQPGESRDAHAMLYLRYKDLDYAVVPFDKESLTELVRAIFKSGRVNVNELEQLLREGLKMENYQATFVYETTRRVPTAAGLPVTIVNKIPTVAALNADVKVHLNLNKKNIKINVRALPQIASTHITHVELYSPLSTIGTKVVYSVQAQLPVDAEIEIRYDTKLNAKLTVKAPEQERRLVALSSRPVTYVRVYQLSAKHYIEPKERTIVSELLNDRTITQQKDMGERATGLRFRLAGHWPRALLEQQPAGQPLALLAGNNFVELRVLPTESTPKQWTLKIEQDQVERTERLAEEPEMEEFYAGKRVATVDMSDLFDTEEMYETELEETETERRQHFTRYTKEMSKRAGYKTQMVVRLVAEQSPVERNAQLIVKSTCEERLRYCKWTVEAERTPIFVEENEKWTVKATAEMMYPEMPTNLQQLKEQKHREFTAQCVAEWGLKTEQKEKIHVRVQGEQTREQKQWMRRVEKVEKIELETRPLEQYEQLIDAAQLNAYKLAADYNVKPTTQRFFNTIFETLKTKYFWNIEEQKPIKNQLVHRKSMDENEQGRVIAHLTVSPRQRDQFNLTIETPFEQVRIIDARLPVRLSPLNIRREFVPLRSLPHTIYRSVAGPRAECVVKSTRVSTFDGLIYKAPMPACFAVIAKDCQRVEQPRFVVLMKKVEENREEKIVRFITEEQQIIELEQKKNGEQEIRLNGEIVSIEQLERKCNELRSVQREGRTVIVLETNELRLRFDGFVARVQLSGLFKNAQCGLCGHYDGEKNDELRTASDELTDDLQRFHESFLYTEEECKLDKQMIKNKKNYELFESVELARSSEESNEEESNEWNNNYNNYDEEEYDVEEKNEKKTWMKTDNKKMQKAWYSDEEEKSEEDEEITIEEETRKTQKPVLRTPVYEKNSKICFAKKPVRQCPKNTFVKEDKTEKMTVEYVCMEREEPVARKMLIQASKAVIRPEQLEKKLEEMNVETSTISRELYVPRLCVVY